MRAATEEGWLSGRKAAFKEATGLIATHLKMVKQDLHVAVNEIPGLELFDGKIRMPPQKDIGPSPKLVAAETVRHYRAAAPAPAGNGSDSDLAPVQRKILNALAEAEQLSAASPPRSLVAILADYTHIQSTGFVKALGALSSAGLITYPPGGRVALTDAGRASSSVRRPGGCADTAEELQERVCKLIGGAATKVLKPLIEAQREPMTRQQLAEASGYTHVHLGL